jgi:hypothetical protein
VTDCTFEIGKCVKNLFEEKNDKFSHTHRLSTRYRFATLRYENQANQSSDVPSQDL